MERNLKLYRKRLIPLETVLLKDDKILFCNEEMLVTKWNVLKPRHDFERGISCYFLKEGYKVSRFFDKEYKMVYDYCDIIETEFLKEMDTYIFTDLLADVLIYENGFVKVVDLAEIAQALERGLLSLELAKKALYRLDNLLCMIYANDLKQKVQPYFEMGLAK
ncbi:MAG TPA: DUF402 domain-containing protein [Candidatus Coprocola pullicola]|nr:DUF402 domain-containing protein [Candidatus Coprocola pullicola]